MSDPTDLTEDALADLVNAFYAKVRADAMIGPLFNAAIGDWPAHLEKLTAFWSSVMLTSGRYKGNPMMQHLKHRHSIDPEMFVRWLAIWKETTEEMMSPPVAAALQEKANRISESLQLTLFHTRPRG